MGLEGNRVAVSFIGGGNMARSLIGGLLTSGTSAAQIHVAEPVEALRAALSQDFHVNTHAEATSAAALGQVWVMAVKPQVMKSVCASLSDLAKAQRPLVISIAAGITTAQIAAWLGSSTAIVRTMPNTPALLGAGITGLFANADASDADRTTADQLLQAAGPTVWVDDESLMDAVTAVSGSGPAYVFLLAQAMLEAGIREGLDAAQAQALANQTILGAARMLTESGDSAEVLRQRVTSPNGTTQAAIESFQSEHFEDIVARAVHAARLRGAALSAAND